jgi:anhydro-N-acetylmuramic acid kinase
MEKIYTALGLMSGTSMDGVDASIIQTDGKSKYTPILDKYFKYPKGIYNNLTVLRDKIKTSKDIKKYQKQIKSVEKDITIFHAESVEKILKKKKTNLDFIGFHGQTIYHNAKKKITKQLGDGKLLSKLTKKKVIYDFRQNDLKNNGQGAPLAPIFHKLLINQNKIPLPVIILNIGGIANVTIINKEKNIRCYDIGPGNCLIDEWIRINSKNNYDKNGKIARLGRSNTQILKKMLKKNKKTKHVKQLSFDIKDFDLSFVRDLSLKDGAATLTNFTGNLLANQISIILSDEYKKPWPKIETFKQWKILVCGGGRKNKTLMKTINKGFSANINLLINMFKSIDIFNIDGDFVESQAFGYLAIRSYLKLPISFPETTGCKKPSTGGTLIKNY